MIQNCPTTIQIESKNSLVHLGSLDSFDITAGGKKAGKLILRYLEKNDKKALSKAVFIYDKLIPNENFGGEYTSLQWLCKLWLTHEEARNELLSIPAVKSFYELLSRDGFADLKRYLNLKYHFMEMPKDDPDAKARLRFLEDFILFNNPDRERWEKTRANMEKFGIEKGMRVADVGSGSGYFTFKFADIVGQDGLVYAIETNPLHLDYLNSFIAKYDIKNVSVVESHFDGIGLDPNIRVDLVYMCSLYHNVYAAFTDYERDNFVGSIRRALCDNGKLIIVDNDLVAGGDLPYHGPYISKDLLTVQLWHYGFELIDSYQFTPQRYVLIFKKTDIPALDHPARAIQEHDGITISSTSSLVRYRIIGTLTSGYSIRGKRIGKKMYEAFENNDRSLMQQAMDEFLALWPLERIGDDYTALAWFCRYYLGTDEQKQAMRSDKLADFYFNFFGGSDFETLKKYLYVKFDLQHQEPEGGSLDLSYDYQGDFPIATLNEWNEFLIFNNPNRVLWEKTDEMLSFIGLKPGERVADIGCGGGYFSWQFSKLVGPQGKVFATEINKDALTYLTRFVKEYHIENIQTLVTRMNEAGLPSNSVDTIFMCSMYHAVYITDIEFVKDQFILSIKKALKDGGRLIIVDNDIPPAGIPSYYGPGIVPELIIKQLEYYGFELAGVKRLIPQRYVLIFRVVDKNIGKPKGMEALKQKLRKTGNNLKREPQRQP
jgi:ubiquinone/menaquinone biosynthesis C-methylase UbiE